MGINNAENGVKNAYVNKIIEHDRILSDLKTHPQKIGNGSLNYATFAVSTIGPLTMSAGGRAIMTVLFMNAAFPFTYNGQPAINRQTLSNVFFTPYIDTYDAAHAADYGGSLTAGQAKVDVITRYDYLGSGLSDTDGEFLVVIKAINNDTASHTIYVDVTALIPRPALAPQ